MKDLKPGERVYIHFTRSRTSAGYFVRYIADSDLRRCIVDLLIEDTGRPGHLLRVGHHREVLSYKVVRRYVDLPGEE